MIETQPTYTHQFRERRAMLDTALKMIGEGNYQISGIREIAFHARLAESTAVHFFPTHRLLLQELERHVAEGVHGVVASALTSSRVSKTRFLNTWLSLYKFYINNPGSLRFVDQCSSILKERDRIEQFYESFNTQLSVLFKSSKTSLSATQRAGLFHMSVLGVAKLRLDQRQDFSTENLQLLATSSWMMLSHHKSTPQQAQHTELSETLVLSS